MLVLLFLILVTVVAFHAATCSPSEFTCANGQCVEYQRHCDGVLDCADGSDEDGCGKLCCKNVDLKTFTIVLVMPSIRVRCL